MSSSQQPGAPLHGDGPGKRSVTTARLQHTHKSIQYCSLRTTHAPTHTLTHIQLRQSNTEKLSLSLTHSHTHTVYLQLLCGCIEADWWQPAIGSLAGSLASLPSRNAPSQPWAGKTKVKKKKGKVFEQSSS